MIYQDTTFHGHQVVLRDIEQSDVETLVSYWHDTDPAYLASIGVDLTKLASRDVTRSRFLSSLPGAQQPPERATFVVTCDGQLVAYTNLNFKSMDEVYAHVHTVMRSSLAKAIVYAYFPEMIKVFFNRFPITRLTMQTSVKNENINRFLAKFGLAPQRVHLTTPDGMARPGDFNVYEIPRSAANQIQRSKLRLSKTYGK